MLQVYGLLNITKAEHNSADSSTKLIYHNHRIVLEKDEVEKSDFSSPLNCH